MKSCESRIISSQSIHDLLTFWNSRKNIDHKIQFKLFPYIHKINGEKNISFRKYQLFDNGQRKMSIENLRHLSRLRSFTVPDISQKRISFRDFLEKYHHEKQRKYTLQENRFDDINVQSISIHNSGSQVAKIQKKNKKKKSLSVLTSTFVHQNKEFIWKEVISKDGMLYYWNINTNTTQYEKPSGHIIALKSEFLDIGI